MGGDKILDQIFNLKFTSKQLVRNAKKCEKEEKAEKLKVKKAIEKGNMEGAKIYAQNAIRKKNEQLNYLQLGSRLDAVVSRLDTQSKMQDITRSMGGIVKALDSAMASNNVEKVAETMEKFEKQFENLDVRSSFVSDAMAGQAALSTPEDEVNGLLRQVADEHQLELNLDMTAAPTTSAAQKVAAPQQPTPQAVDPEADLTARLAQLRGRG